MSVAAFLAAYASAPSQAVPPPDETPPSTPPSFRVTAVATNQIDLAWGASTDNRGVTGYRINRCPGACSPWVTLASTARSYSSTGLTSGVKYTYMIVAIDAAGNESVENSTSATTLDNVPPSAPSNLGASAASGTQINLSWTASTDNVAVQGYAIEYCAGSGCSPVNALATTGSTSYSVTGLSAATSYTFRVRAYDAQSNYGGYSGNASATTSDVTAPSVPTRLSAATASGTQITLSWSASTDNVGVALYSIEYCAGSGCSPTTFLTNTIWTSFDATGLTPATSYTFRIRAADASNNYSGYTSPVSATTNDTLPPSTPTSFTATAASGTQINLSWGASSDNVGVYLYDIDYCQGSGCANYVFLGSTASTSLSATGLTPATTYTFRIRARDAAYNVSPYASPAAATTQDTVSPSAPAGLSAAAASSTQINLSWTASTDNVAVAAYHIERCAGAACTNFAEVATTTSTLFSNTGLTDATTYRYQVRARDAFPNYSGYSNIAAAPTPDGTAPSVPTGLAATPASPTQINLTWVASTDNVGVTGYAVERCQGSGCTSFTQIATPSTNSFNDTTASSGLTYRYQVRARDALPNWSGYSAAASATTADNVPPGAPTSLVATPISAMQVDLTWTAPTDNVAVTGYELQRCQGASCTTFATIATPASAGYNDTGRTPGTTYRYQVRARDAVPNWGAYSSIATAATSADNSSPSVPTGFAATPASPTQVNLSWTASTDNVAVTGYEVQRCQGSGCTSWASIATPTGTTFNDTGRTPNTLYRYQVRARDSVPNWSAFTTPISATTQADTTAPSVPVLVVTGTTVTSVTMTLSSTDDVGVTGYQLDRCTGTGCTTFTQIATPTSSPYTDTGRAPNTVYQYRARARDAAGNTSASSGAVAATTPADSSAPTAPGNLRTTSKTDTTVSLAWDASTDNVGVTSYRVQRCTGAGCNTWAEVGSTNGSTTTYTSTGLTQLTSYRFRIGARDGANNTTYNTPISVTTNDGQAPTAPSGLTITPQLGQIVLQWGASTDNVGVTAYLVERCNTASCSYTQIASTGGLSYADTNLSASTDYSYRVAARDAQGNVSGYSTVGTATSADCD